MELSILFDCYYKSLDPFFHIFRKETGFKTFDAHYLRYAVDCVFH